MVYDSRDHQAELTEGGGHEEKKEEEGGGGSPKSSSSASSAAAAAWASSGGVFTLGISGHQHGDSNANDDGGGVASPASSNESPDATMQHDPVDPPEGCYWGDVQMREQLRQQRVNMATARQQLEYSLMKSSIGPMQLDAAHHQRQLQAAAAAAAALQSAFLGPAMTANFVNPLVAAQIQHQVLVQQQQAVAAVAVAQAAALSMAAAVDPSVSSTAVEVYALGGAAGVETPAAGGGNVTLAPPFATANHHHHHPRAIDSGGGEVSTPGIDPAVAVAADRTAIVSAATAARAQSSAAIPLSSATDPTAAATATTLVATPLTTHHHHHHPQFIHVRALSPQMTVPHYVPPTCASWGAQVPALSVQDRPLVPPIYNGINPNYPGARLLHAQPPIFAVEDFLSHAECDFLIDAASDAFGPAPVVGRGSGEVSPSRTSSTCYLAREDLPEYLRKVSMLTGKPPEHCELPQVGRYLAGERYLQHFDAFDLTDEDGRRFAANGGQRTVTVLVYLNDVAQGGATAFPNLNIEVCPRRGMAVVFFPSTLDGLLDRMALHAALPAVDVKYVSQVWIRQSNYEGRPSKRLPGPMVAGLQEMRDALEQQGRAMMGHLQHGQQQQFALLHPQLAQQQIHHQHVQAHNNHAQLQQLQQRGFRQQMEG
jgi:prolyl 4-hydroxylase